MARRDRVTRLKSHRTKANKNPKLSPFQREQKRTKLANQPPIIKPNERDAPKSQRLVLEYLEAKRKRKEDKKAEDLRLREERLSRPSSNPGTSDREASPRKAMQKEKPKARCSEPETSLNHLLGSSLGPAVVAFPTADGSPVLLGPNAIVARKKERKHQKRVASRRERVKVDVTRMMKELEKLKGGKRKKEQDPNIAFEKELKAMQREKATEDKRQLLAQQQLQRKTAKEAEAALETAALENESRTTRIGTKGEEDDSSTSKKRISFDESVPNYEASDGVKGPQRVKRKAPRDFSDLVDVVRFNDRVEAPPVFNVVPNRNAAVSRLAHRLEAEGAAGGTPTRHRLLSSAGGLGEQKRLSRLGLRPAATQLSFAREAKESKEKEMEALRAHVMAAYQKKKRRRLEESKGVDMTHRFPSL